MPLRFQDTASQVEIHCSQEVSRLLCSYRQQGVWSREKGGLLFTRHANTPHVEVVSASPPHPADRATRTSLYLDHPRCLREIRTANDDGHWFIGYWHTHPERNPRISFDDISAFERNLKSDAGISGLLAIIVGNRGREDECSAYFFRGGRMTVLLNVS